jgi:hypothetical protein
VLISAVAVLSFATVVMGFIIYSMKKAQASTNDYIGM